MKSNQRTTIQRFRRGTFAAGMAFVVFFVVISVSQVVRQLFFSGIQPGTPPPCEVALRGLYQALERANRASEERSDVSESLAAFRQALLPEWGNFGTAKRACDLSPQTRHGLDALERLRYAEENAVRLEASSLHTLRNRVRHDLDALGALPSPETTPPRPTKP